MSDNDISLTDKQREAILENLFQLLLAHYVFPEIAVNIKEGLSKQLADGDYDELTAVDVFCEVITEQMQEIGQDRHLCLYYRAEAQPLYGNENLFKDLLPLNGECK